MDYLLNGLPYFPGTTIFGTGLFADGTAAAPSVSFLSAPTLGIYRYSASALGVAVSGAQSIVIGAGGQIFGPGLSALLTLGSAGSITATAGGTNQSIVLTPSGTGVVICGSSGNGFTFLDAVGYGLYYSGTTTILKAAGANALTADNTGKIVKVSDTFLNRSSVAMANGAAAASGTLLNAPVAGNPTKWLSVDDNGTTRQVPSW